MAVSTPSQTNFNAGEFSPWMVARVGLEQYSNGCAELANFIPLVQGPALRRSGIRYVAPIKAEEDRTWLYPFRFSDDTAFILEFGNQYIRFYTNHFRVETSPGVPYEVASPYTSASLTNSDGTFRLSMEQSGDVIYIAHGDYWTRKLTRIANTNWTLALADFKGGPFIGVNPDETRTVYASAATGTGITVTASTAIFNANHVGSLFLIEQKKTDTVTHWEVGKTIGATGLERRNGGNIYQSASTGTTGTAQPVHLEGSRYDGDAGVLWEYLHSGYGVVKITAIGGGGTTATADVVTRIPSSAVGSGNATTRWSFAEWNEERGYPSHVTFYNERLALLRGTQLWLSVVADFEDFSNRDGADVTADMAISIDIASDQINDAAWVAPGNQLLVGSVGNEFAVSPLSNADPLGPANIEAKQQTAHGSRQVRPVRVNDSLLFVQRAGRKLREIRYSFDTSSYSTNDLTVLADHITKGQIVQLAFQQEPHAIVWSCCNDGSLLGFTFNREQRVTGWHRHPVGGTGATVESVATIPSPYGDRDELWMIVRRDINGATHRYVEYMERDWNQAEGSTIEDAFFVDSGLTYDGAPATVLSGLDHLEGETLQCLADGAAHPDVTVSGGSVTLQRQASKAHVGYGYTSRLTTMKIEAVSDFGTAQSKIKRIAWVKFRLQGTRGGVAGPPDGPKDPIMYRSPADPMGAALSPFSGDTERLSWPNGYETDGQITIEQNQPLPMAVCGLIAFMEVNE